MDREDDLNNKLNEIIELYHAPEPMHMDDHIRSHEEYAEQIAVPLLARIKELEYEVARLWGASPYSQYFDDDGMIKRSTHRLLK